jgi:hypothetical protein
MEIWDKEIISHWVNACSPRLMLQLCFSACLRVGRRQVLDKRKVATINIYQGLSLPDLEDRKNEEYTQSVYSVRLNYPVYHVGIAERID